MSESDVNRAILITLICVVWLLVQLCILGYLYLRHPPVYTGLQSLESKKDVNGNVVKGTGTKENFKGLMISILLGVESQHHKKLFTDWLLVEEVNVNNYEDKDTTGATTETRNEVSVDVNKLNTETWICKFLNNYLKKTEDVNDNNSSDPVLPVTNSTTGRLTQPREINSVKDITGDDLEKLVKYFQKNPKERVDQTPMMKVIDYHVKVVTWVYRLKQLNFQFDFEKCTESKMREERLPFRRVVKELRTVDEKPQLPKALGNSVIRELKKKAGNPEKVEWSRQNDGTPLNPIILSEQPWLNLEQAVKYYLFSFMNDLALHWVKLWVIFVLFEIVFAKGK